MPRKKPEWLKELEKKYMKEVLWGATYIDARQRKHFRKWVREQLKKMKI